MCGVYCETSDVLLSDKKSSLAVELERQVRVLCWVMTSPESVSSKAQHVKATWGSRCNVLLFMSSETNSELPAVGLNVSEGHENLWGKTRAAFLYVHQHHRNDADWFLKADDDTYIIVENLRLLLRVGSLCFIHMPLLVCKHIAQHRPCI